MRIACLDLGTNTFLCLIAELGQNGFKEIFDTFIRRLIKL